MEISKEIIETHIVPQLSLPMRLQEYGIGIFESITTKSALKKILKKKCITVDRELASSATFIKGGESINLKINYLELPKKKLIFPLKVIFEDEYLAVIHKPAGILVSGNSFKTIANALRQNLKWSNMNDACVPQPVHRIDFATTGILLVGKTRSSIQLLNKMFENKLIDKIYYAVNIGIMFEKGEISSPIDDKVSLSKYITIASVESERFNMLNLLKLDPKTGRRHQLRKHLSSIGNPVFGDKDYGKEGLILNGKGMYLHAYSIEFAHPFTNKTVFITDNLPENFVKIFPKVKL